MRKLTTKTLYTGIMGPDGKITVRHPRPGERAIFLYQAIIKDPLVNWISYDPTEGLYSDIFHLCYWNNETAPKRDRQLSEDEIVIARKRFQEIIEEI
jgi:hypothetical protein